MRHWARFLRIRARRDRHPHWERWRWPKRSLISAGIENHNAIRNFHSSERKEKESKAFMELFKSLEDMHFESRHTRIGSANHRTKCETISECEWRSYEKTTDCAQIAHNPIECISSCNLVEVTTMYVSFKLSLIKIIFEILWFSA